MSCVININNVDYEVDENRKLLDILRKDLHLTAAKDGCSEGACGTCTVVAGGKAVKACVQKASAFVGKPIITVEGLSDREKDVYQYAFGHCGAVQCGFCIPGMVMCAKALIDENPNPTKADIRKAIRGNICRCTGYKKIIEAIEFAAKIFRENLPTEHEVITHVGQRVARIDAAKKTLGYGEYVDDMHPEGMLYGAALRSAYPRARVLSIDTEDAKKLKGVHAVVTAADIPGKNKIGHLNKDWDTLIEVGAITHYLGDAIVLIAAESEEIIEEAKKLVKIEYEELDAVFDPIEALKDDAPKVHSGGNVLAHEHLVRGDVEKALKESKYVVSNTYVTPFTEHAFLEPECALAIVDPDKKEATVYSTDQGTYQTAQECSEMLGFESGKVHVINKLVGGGFGGKEDMTVQHFAALLSYHTRRPVKVKLTRKESILVHPKRHACVMNFTTACDENGYLTAMKAELISDTGAYASLGGPVLQRACTHAAGPYNYQNIDMDGKAVYTNNPPAGAFRGFGVTQSNFATECNLDQLAEKVGISPWEIRYRNAIRPGQELPNGQIASEGTALAETLEAVKDIYEKHPRAGIACAMKNAGVGVGIADWGRCRLTIEDGKIHIRSGASDIGQGLGTVLVHFVAETAHVTSDDCVYEDAETIYAPDAGTTSGSRQTVITGEACIRASKLLLEDLEKGNTLNDLNGKEYYGEFLAKTDPMGSDKKNPVSHICYGYATQVVLLSEDGTVERVVAAHDVGKAVNPISLEGQIEGGVVMSLGYAFTEDFPLEKGNPKAKFGTLGLFRADKTPPVDAIIVEKNQDPVAYGAIGVGEITSIPTPAAAQNAYYKYDGVFRTVLPLEHTAYRK